MNTCKCELLTQLEGDDASLYSKNHLQKITDHGAWIQLWKCPNDSFHFEATWVGGAEFHNGMFTLRKISKIELEKNWPQA
jgi:hypothetical protein